MTQNTQTVIFFDLDGTLMVNPFDRAVWPVVLGEIAAKANMDEGEIWSLLVTESAKRQHDDSTSPVLSMDWDDIAPTVAGRLGVQLEAKIEQLVRDNAAISSVLDNGADVLRELNAAHRALVGSIPPQDRLADLPLIARSLSAPEMTALLAATRSSAPPAFFSPRRRLAVMRTWLFGCSSAFTSSVVLALVRFC